MSSSPSQSKVEKTSFAVEAGTAQPALLPVPPQPPRLDSRPFLHLFPLTAPLSQSRVPRGPPLLLGSWWRSKHSSSGVPPGRGRAASPRPHHRLGLRLRCPRCGAQQRGPVPRPGQRRCPSSSRVFNNAQPQALPRLPFAGDWLSGQTFSVCKCPAKSIFYSFFL